MHQNTSNDNLPESGRLADGFERCRVCKTKWQVDLRTPICLLIFADTVEQRQLLQITKTPTSFKKLETRIFTFLEI